MAKTEKNKTGKKAQKQALKGKGKGKVRVLPTPTPKAKPKPRAKRRRASFSMATIRALAMDVKNMAEAEEKLDAKNPLEKILKNFPKLKTSWNRGRFLRNLRGLAASATSVVEAAHALAITPEKLQDILDSDMEARDVWNQARVTTMISVKAGLVGAAQKGKPTAVTTVLAALRRDIATPRIDFHHLTVNQTETATGFSRQTLHAWWKKQGAPKNADGTFNLPILWEWFGNYVLRQSGPKSSPNESDIRDPLKRAKAEKLSRELNIQKGQLLDRNEVLAGLVARHQMLISMLQRKPAELAVVLQGQNQERTRQTLLSFFADLRRQMLDVPESLRLSKPMSERFIRFLKKLEEEEEAA